MGRLRGAFFLTAGACWLSLAALPVRADEPVDYERQIKPLLAEHCAACHGVDDPQSGLRLDAGSLAVKGGDRGAAVIPGKASDSLLVKALFGDGDIPRMPAEADPLPEADIALIKRWIDEGAKFPSNEEIKATTKKSTHWSFQPIVRHPVPAHPGDPSANSIDAFIRARLAKENLQPSTEADRATLVRRLSLDLRGLPPSIDEVDEFVADELPGAYDRLVDRMLASPQFGERFGRHWLDVARYADSNGFTIDGARSIWKYRDWVIGAINADLPFDQFTIEQLAGDLLPNPTTDQLVATGFHRNTLVNEEGGTDDEQFRVESVVDRVSTTGSAFLGLTVACAQCHAHKFDPITQREFYDLYAIFNNCDEPQLPVPSPEQTAQVESLAAAIAAAEVPLREHDAKFLEGMPAWEQSLATLPATEWAILDPQTLTTEKGALLVEQPDQSVFVDFSIPPNDTFHVTFDAPQAEITALRLEALTHDSLPMKGPGRADNGNFVLNEVEASVETIATAGAAPAAGVPLKFQSAVADYAQEGYPAKHVIDGKADTGWAINVDKGSLNVNRELVLILDGPLRAPLGSRVEVRLKHAHKDPNYLLGRFRVSATSAPPELLRIPAPIRAILAKPADQRSDAERDQLVAAYRQTDAERAPLADKLGQLKLDKESLEKSIPTTLILKERAEARASHIQIRGDFLRLGARVTGGVPAVLPPIEGNPAAPTRLDFARWLVSPKQPLTTRVTVNRFWQQLFGRGIVRTENDFGTQGDLPTHPELLDWLSDEWMRQGWSVKSLVRLIVTSDTYRQSSEMRPELLEADPDNHLLARQSRIRLEAETIRDACLASSGLLSTTIGGPSVHPPQPEGIYVMTQVKKAWPESQGADRYRRGMYTYFWRSSPYPLLPTFDAPDANTTCTRRVRSNTPLQALTLANDRAFYEIAQGLASRMLHDVAKESPYAATERLRYGFRACLSRDPSESELASLGDFLASQRKAFSSDAAAAKSAAPTDRPADVDVVEAASWTAVARVLLNVDEFITRE